MTAPPDDDLSEPAPPWLCEEFIDRDVISSRLAAMFEAEDQTAFLDLLAGELRWVMGPFDPQGWTTIYVVRLATGEQVGEAAAHWSSIVTPVR